MKISKETKTLLDGLRTERQANRLRGNDLARANETLKQYETMLLEEGQMVNAERDADPNIKVDSCNAVKKENFLANAAIRRDQLRGDLARTERNFTEALLRFYQVTP